MAVCWHSAPTGEDYDREVHATVCRVHVRLAELTVKR